MKRKQILAAGLLSALLAVGTVGMALADTPEITVNGEKVEVTEKLFEENGQTMVPLRAVAEKMGYEVCWYAKEQSICVVDGGWQILMWIGKDEYFGATNEPGTTGMTAPMEFGAPPRLVNGRTCIPAAVFELLGWEYEGAGQAVNFRRIGQSEEPADEPAAGMANPFAEYNTPTELAEQMGFKVMEISELPEDITETVYIGSNFGLAQVLYCNEAGECLRLRQQKGSGDISGDYNEYPKVKSVTFGGTSCTLKGGAEGYYLALWEDQGYAFSLRSEEPASEAEFIAYIESLGIRE